MDKKVVPLRELIEKQEAVIASHKVALQEHAARLNDNCVRLGLAAESATMTDAEQIDTVGGQDGKSLGAETVRGSRDLVEPFSAQLPVQEAQSAKAELLAPKAKGFSFVCRWCGVSCRVDYLDEADVCLRCAKEAAADYVSDEGCPRGHRLKVGRAPSLFECDACGKHLPQGRCIFDCRPCDITLCMACFARRQC